MRESQADMNRPFFMNDLGDVLKGIPAIHDRLSAQGARGTDIGCGAGWSTLALAHAYPNASFTGFDVDAPSSEMAKANAAAAGVADRVTFTTEDVGTNQHEAYDVAFAFECIHDMPRPVGVLQAMHAMVHEGGIAVVMDEAVGEEFKGEGDEVERLMYGFSLLVCLPDGLSSQPSVGTGTVLRPSQLTSLATEAGFAETTSLTEAGFFRFYELTP
jgi:SAM-dependent methyltransferase